MACLFHALHTLFVMLYLHVEYLLFIFEEVTEMQLQCFTADSVNQQELARVMSPPLSNASGYTMISAPLPSPLHQDPFSHDSVSSERGWGSGESAESGENTSRRVLPPHHTTPTAVPSNGRALFSPRYPCIDPPAHNASYFPEKHRYCLC